MRKYLKKIEEERTPHERRQFALRVAGSVTAVIFVGWLATLGVRIGNMQQEVAENARTNSQSAAVGGIIPVQEENTLYVAPTTSR